MAFNQEELGIIEYAKSNNKTRQETEQALLKYRTTKMQAPAPVEQQGYLSRVGSELKGAYQGLQKTTERGAELMGGGKPIEGVVMAGLGTPAAAIRAAFSPITAALSPLIESGLKATGVTENETVQNTLAGLDTWAKAHPDAAENLKNIFEIGSTVGVGKLATAVKPALERGVKTGVDVTTGAIKTGIEAVAPITTGAIDVAKMTSGAVSRIPSRIATNVAEKQAQEATIRTLPTKIAQTAARDGIDIPDINIISNLAKTTPKPIKEQFGKLASVVQKFAKGETTTNPIEIVGKPLVNRIKQLESARGKVGQRLGKIADNLGDVKSNELATPIFNELKRTKGLEGLTINKKGILDFTNTTLRTAENAAARKSIQKNFMDAIKSETGKQKHLLRQELFEVLGGKKRAGVQLTGTQENAYESIRRGLSNVLEGKNAGYKAVSNEYRNIMQPLADLRKFMKTIPEATEDILDMQAGLLARRLTSAAPSNPQIRAILKRIDSATAIKGKSQLSLEKLQDFYNILDKYYDIAPKTGFKGQTTQAVATGLTELATGAIKGVAGETIAVRQKALERLLQEIFMK